ncbi:MAG TPA: hypothetical protein ENI20_08430 [Bacteroides sp.]|nr:hypothetical protein [Bacteroides sp.]
MYKLNPSPQAKAKLSELINSKYRKGIENKLEALEKDPSNLGKPIDNRPFGDYYINAGNRYAITYIVDENKKRVDILEVPRQEKLHKLLLDYKFPY